ncbi:MAG TPA: hypothetical protein VH420_00085 [Gaiellaceae bacterium]|jgi:hypothetical protein
MYFEIPREIVEQHHERLRDAAQAPPPRFLVRLVALIRREREPAQVIPLSRRELERLAA